MLELWKPIKVNRKNHRHQSVIFDTFGKEYHTNFRPFVIFYDDKDDIIADHTDFITNTNPIKK